MHGFEVSLTMLVSLVPVAANMEIESEDKQTHKYSLADLCKHSLWLSLDKKYGPPAD